MAKEIYNSNPDISGARQSEENKNEERRKQAQRNSQMSRWERFTSFFTSRGVRFTTGLALFLAGMFMALSFVSFFFTDMADQSRVENFTLIENAAEPAQIQNAGAALGAWLSNFLISDGFGVAAFLLVLWSITVGYRMMKPDGKVHFFNYTMLTFVSIVVWSIVIGAITSSIATFSSPTFPFGGHFGWFVNRWLYGLVGWFGMVAVNILLIVIWGFVCSTLIMMVYNRIKDFKDRHSTSDGISQDDEENGPVDDYVDADDEPQQNKPKPKDSTPAPVYEADPRKGSAPRSERADDYNAPTQPAQGDEPNKRRDRRRNVDAPPMDEPEMEHGKMADIEAARKPTNPGDPTGEYIHYKFPTLDLLADRTINTNSVDIEEQEENKQRIISTLGNYGITIKSIEVHVGPTVTLFEIVPEDGTRISKIRGLEDDIALSLKAIGIRIIAPMPGRGTIGIEIPNRDPQVVPMRQVLASKAFQESKAKLPMCLGCTVSNEVFVADLTKMPHLLVAGATGKGKSVGLNAIITSLLFKKGPSELKLVLVDPKRVEFSIYAGIEKYFLAMAPGEDRAIITDTDRVVHTLNCLVQEMENRYEVLEQVHVRNVQDYNDKWRRELREVRDEHGDKVYHFMPYIVAVVDEFSDMIMTSGKEVETPIVRIAQKARAVGIHMIIATQRPSAQVITGLIKANFPGRVAFAVTALVDSRIILDTGGAQRLIGRGDMLFQVDGETTRLQCPFVDTPEVEKICEFIKEQEDADKNIYHEKTFELPEYVGSGAESGGGGAEAVNPHDRDPLFDQALDLVLRGDTASTSSLQRALQVGFARAGRIMDQMEALGIVGPSTGGKPRKVLVQSRMDVDNILAALG